MKRTKAPAATLLGKLCKNGHDHMRTGKSLRFLVDGKPTGNCIVCARERNRRTKEDLRLKRELLNRDQGLEEGKYRGPVCRAGHDGLRYVRDGSCVPCERQRRKALAAPQSPKDQERKRISNQNRATKGLDPDLANKRIESFKSESVLRRELKEIKSRDDSTSICKVLKEVALTRNHLKRKSLKALNAQLRNEQDNRKINHEQS